MVSPISAWRRAEQASRELDRRQNANLDLLTPRRAPPKLSVSD